MENNFNGYGMKLPKQNFNGASNDRFTGNFSNNYSGNLDPQNKTPFTSLDGRKWETKDQEFRANQEYYRDYLGKQNKK